MVGSNCSSPLRLVSMNATFELGGSMQRRFGGELARLEVEVVSPCLGGWKDCDMGLDPAAEFGFVGFSMLLVVVWWTPEFSSPWCCD